MKFEGEGPVSSEEEFLSIDRGYTSDSELVKSPRHGQIPRPQSPNIIPITIPPQTNNGGWILVSDSHSGITIISYFMLSNS